MYEKYLTLLNQTGESTYKVSKATGIPQSTLSNWKAGRYVPKTEKLKKLADHFGVSIEYFIT